MAFRNFRRRSFRGGARRRRLTRWAGANLGLVKSSVAGDINFTGGQNIDFLLTTQCNLLVDNLTYAQDQAATAPLESGAATIARIRGQLNFSAQGTFANDVSVQIQIGIVIVNVDSFSLKLVPNPSDLIGISRAGDWMWLYGTAYELPKAPTGNAIFELPKIDIDVRARRRLDNACAVLVFDAQTTGVGGGEAVSVQLAGQCRTLLMGNF